MTITTTVWFRSDGTYLVLRDEVDISASVAGLILQLSTDGPASHGQISGTFVGTAELPADLAHIPPGRSGPTVSPQLCAQALLFEALHRCRSARRIRTTTGESMTDEELAAVLRRYLRGLLVDGPDVVDAIERAIDVLSPCPQCGAGLIVHVCHTDGWPEVHGPEPVAS